MQEYGRYFDMPTVCFRGGCLTGPNHAGTELHGFLSYLMRCTMTGEPYTVFGYGGKQVRDNIHAADLVAAFEAFHRAPRAAAVYNIGGGRQSNCSMLEAIELCQEIAGRELSWSLGEENRIGDHRWWISDLEPFKRDYPGWDITYDVRDILAPDPRAQRRALGRRGMKLSVVIPAHDEVESIGATVRAVAAELQAEQIPYEIVVVDDSSSDGTGEAVRADRRRAIRGCAACARHARRASARRCARGSTSTRETPSRS